MCGYLNYVVVLKVTDFTGKWEVAMMIDITFVFVWYVSGNSVNFCSVGSEEIHTIVLAWYRIQCHMVSNVCETRVELPSYDFRLTQFQLQLLSVQNQL